MQTNNINSAGLVWDTSSSMDMCNAPNEHTYSLTETCAK
jgi:hypothetical protein